MTEDEGMQWLVDKMSNPTIFERINKTFKQSLKNKSETNNMRKQLIQEFKSPFVERVKTTSSDPLSKQMIIEYFDERIKTLPDTVIMDIHEDYLKSKMMKTDKGRDMVKNYILNHLELSYSLDGWFMEKLFTHLKKK